MTWLWTLLRDLFDTDDGSLPEVDLRYSSRDALTDAYGVVVSKARSVLPEDASIEVDGQEVPLATVKNPAALVAWGQAPGLHVVACGVTLGGATIPDLGVCISSDELTLDYRMGEDWGPPELEALFSLFLEITSYGKQSRPSVLRWWGVAAETRFQRAWAQYLKERAA